MKLSIIIPVYNEAKTIHQILAKIEQVPFSVEKEIIIVDDFSTDGTREVLAEMAARYSIVYHDKNRGKGAAIRSGLAFATGDYTVVQDADLEYDPNDLHAMMQEALSRDLTVLYGSRRLKDNVQHSGISYFLGGYFLTVLTNILYGQKLTDEPTCYKLFKTDFLKSMPLVCERFEFCPEVTALTALQGIKIPEIGISYYPRDKSQGKKIRWRDGVEAISTLLKYRIK